MRDLNWNYNAYMEREKETVPIDDVVEKRRDMQATILMMEAKVDALSLKRNSMNIWLRHSMKMLCVTYRQGSK